MFLARFTIGDDPGGGFSWVIHFGYISCSANALFGVPLFGALFLILIFASLPCKSLSPMGFDLLCTFSEFFNRVRDLPFISGLGFLLVIIFIVAQDIKTGMFEQGQNFSHLQAVYCLSVVGNH